MIPTVLSKAVNPAVALSGGRDSLLVLAQVREYESEIDVLVFKTDFTAEQWSILDKVIRLWDLTVVAPPPKASYLIPNGENLARVDEYDIGNRATLPVVRDILHSERCLFDLNSTFLRISPLDYDVIFVGTRQGDTTPAMGRALLKPITEIGTLTVVAPIFYWSDEQVEEASKELPYAREWYEEGDEVYDTGNLLSCSACVRSGTGDPVYCLKEGMEIDGVVWDQGAMLKTFQEKYGFEGA